MSRCSLCDSENVEYDSNTKIGYCNHCGLNFVHRDLGISRQRAMAAIADKSVSNKVKINELILSADSKLVDGDYYGALEDFATANGISAENVMAMAGRFVVMLKINPGMTVYQMQYSHTGRVILLCIESMATEEEYATIEAKYGCNLRRNYFEFWYDGLKSDVDDYWKLAHNHKNNKGEVIRKHALGINAAFHRAIDIANDDQKVMLKELCRGKDLLIVDRIVYGHLGFVTGSEEAIIPEGVAFIFKDAFKHCRLKVVKTPKSLMMIDSFAFYDAEIDELYMETVSKLDPPLELAECSFCKCRVKHISGDVSLIKNAAFRMATIGEAKFGFVETIGTKAFVGAKIDRLTACSVKSIFPLAFEGAVFNNIEFDDVGTIKEDAFKDAKGHLRVRFAKNINLAEAVRGTDVTVSEGGDRVMPPKAHFRKLTKGEKIALKNETGSKFSGKFGSFFGRSKNS